MPKRPNRFLTICLITNAALIGVCIVIEVLSIMVGLTRLVLAGTVVFTAFTVLVRAHSALRTRRRAVVPTLVVVGVLLLAGIAVMSTGARTSSDDLRATYAERLRSFMGLRYVWGGETHFGIDCSGLARTAFWEAMATRGVRDRDPRLLGPAMWRFWWQDIGADAMGRGAHGYTVPIGFVDRLSDERTIHLKPGEKLLPGDLAVTGSNTHVMIYLGDGTWIEANPEDGRVVANRSVASKRPYFNMRARLLRWWLLYHR